MFFSFTAEILASICKAKNLGGMAQVFYEERPNAARQIQ